MLEVVGVTGVVHLGQIQSGLRSAMRIAQVSRLKNYRQSHEMGYMDIISKYNDNHENFYKVSLDPY